MQPNSPFQSQPTGPTITPKTMNATGQGGVQNPPYLQMRAPTGGPPGIGGMPQSAPVITPRASAPGDTVNPQQPKPLPNNPSVPPVSGGPPISPPPSNGTPPQAGGNDLGSLYKFFASDLANKTTQAKSNAISDASARGVYYGTPLTGSEADIDTQYLRGMGQLQSGMYGNEQQNQLARLGLATGLQSQGFMNAPSQPAPMDWSGFGALFGNQQPGQAPGTSTRNGPVITPPSKNPNQPVKS
jgi:hypothetical protein